MLTGAGLPLIATVVQPDDQKNRIIARRPFPASVKRPVPCGFHLKQPDPIHWNKNNSILFSIVSSVQKNAVFPLFATHFITPALEKHQHLVRLIFFCSFILLRFYVYSVDSFGFYDFLQPKRSRKINNLL